MWWSSDTHSCLSSYSKVGEEAQSDAKTILCPLGPGDVEGMAETELCCHMAPSLSCHNLSRTCTDFISTEVKMERENPFN